MSDLRDLYQEVVIDHSKRPRNFRKMEDANRTAEGFNPLCGDRISLYLKIENGRVADVAFQGSGCAISTASASIMTEVLMEKSVTEAEKIFQVFHRLVTGELAPGESAQDLGKLAVFEKVSDYPARVKCASLAWHTLNSALRDGSKTVTTE